MKRKYTSKKYKTYSAYKGKNHINPMKAIFCSVFAIFFAIAFSLMWIGINMGHLYFILIGGGLTALCLLLAIVKWAKTYRNFARY